MKTTILILVIGLTLFSGCAGTQQDNLYTCLDGRKVSDQELCSINTIAATTTTTLYPYPKPERICRFNESNNACTDDNGTYYPVGKCENNIKIIAYYACDKMGWWCEEKEFENSDCSTTQKICIPTPENDSLLKNSALNLVRCINAKYTNQTGGQNITVTGK